MLRPHFVVFQCSVQFLVFTPLLFLFKSFDFLLLLEKSHLNTSHVVVTFQHLREKIIGSCYRYFCLDQESHAFHDVFAN